MKGAVIRGYPDGLFRPERHITRAETAAILARLLAGRRGELIPGSVSTGFRDVDAGAWFSGCVAYLADAGVIYAEDGQKFRPYHDITRSEFVDMTLCFADAYGGDLRTVELCAGNGEAAGDTITRAEAVVLLGRLLGRVPDQAYMDANPRRLRTFPDVDPSHWAYYPIMDAANRAL